MFANTSARCLWGNNVAANFFLKPYPTHIYTKHRRAHMSRIHNTHAAWLLVLRLLLLVWLFIMTCSRVEAIWFYALLCFTRSLFRIVGYSARFTDCHTNPFVGIIAVRVWTVKFWFYYQQLVVAYRLRTGRVPVWLLCVAYLVYIIFEHNALSLDGWVGCIWLMLWGAWDFYHFFFVWVCVHYLHTRSIYGCRGAANDEQYICMLNEQDKYLHIDFVKVP